MGKRFNILQDGKDRIIEALEVVCTRASRRLINPFGPSCIVGGINHTISRGLRQEFASVDLIPNRTVVCITLQLLIGLTVLTYVFVSLEHGLDFNTRSTCTMLLL